MRSQGRSVKFFHANFRQIFRFLSSKIKSHLMAQLSVSAESSTHQLSGEIRNYWMINFWVESKNYFSFVLRELSEWMEIDESGESLLVEKLKKVEFLMQENSLF